MYSFKTSERSNLVVAIVIHKKKLNGIAVIPKTGVEIIEIIPPNRPALKFNLAGKS